MRFYTVNTVMSAFTLLEVIAGATFLVAATISVLHWLRKPTGGARLTVFDQLLDRVHARRTEIFAGHRSPPGTIQAREELLAETRLRLRHEKSFFSERREPSIMAFTLIELLVAIVVMALCVGILLPALMRAKPRAARTTYVNNLKQVGLSCRIFGNDHGDKYPVQVSTKEGGTLELVEGPNAFRHFQAMANELSTPKILICPEDRQRTRAATNFAMDLNNSKLSYFFGLDATEADVRTILSGDRNLTNGFPLQNGTLLLTTNQNLGWTKQIHVDAGNICLADGSVQQLMSSALERALRDTGIPTNRLAMP
jgi:type II secretory pathway pseudopilin PulG